METAKLRLACLLLFFSGACALAYQVGWLRELRLVFGASTAASAAVLAIFMGGLGAGGALLGRKADASPSPLRFYGVLEISVGLLAAATPLLLSLIRSIYIALGGSQALGALPSALVRLALAAVVLGVPTFLMGGTMPAAAKAVEDAADAGRRRMAFLYGTNTLGAVLGAFASTFFFLEIFGTRRTLWLAALANILVGMAAINLSRKPGFAAPSSRAAAAAPAPEALTGSSPAAPLFVYLSAFLVGAAFFLMEIVWYRMLGPILGGSTYTFGMILCVALLGIGVGGALYALFSGSSQASLRAFCITLLLEALFLALPYALGDRVALLAALLTPLSVFGLKGQMLSWLGITGLVILPAAVISGYQFPLLVSLLGRGGEKIGRHIGNAYAWNTAGAILGSLAGGFGLLPLLSATGCWILVCALLAAWGVLCLVLSLRPGEKTGILAPIGLAAACVLLLLRPAGPTAVWRHTPIGAGRINLSGMTQNQIKNWMNASRRNTIWEKDGVESSIAINNVDSYSFMVNGKSDGNAKSDAPTQVPVGLLSAVFHPAPRRAMVIGLGTGETAGWLGRVPGMERVDVAELEPDICEVARRCTDMNQDVFAQDNVKIMFGDGREILLTSKERYDLIVSEPSNPYRAGVASLYTREFYEAVANRLSEDGIFNQWVQAYEVDATTVRTILATLSSVFEHVELWQGYYSDLQLLCFKKAHRIDAEDLRRRLSVEPYRSAFRLTWWSDSPEGFLARFVASDDLVRLVSHKDRNLGLLNTDDRMLVEFGFARTVGKNMDFHVDDIRRAALDRGGARPEVAGVVDWDAVTDNIVFNNILFHQPVQVQEGLNREQQHLADAVNAFYRGDHAAALESWKKSGRKSGAPAEWIMLGESYAMRKDKAALELADKLLALWPVEAEALRALYYNAEGRTKEAAAAFSKVIIGLRTNPWPETRLMGRTFQALMRGPLLQDREEAPKIFELLAQPFSTGNLEEIRKAARADLAFLVPPERGVAAYLAYEPNPLVNEAFLRNRLYLYANTGNPLAQKAQDDLADFYEGKSVSFASFLPPKETAPGFDELPPG